MHSQLSGRLDNEEHALVSHSVARAHSTKHLKINSVAGVVPLSRSYTSCLGQINCRIEERGSKTPVSSSEIQGCPGTWDKVGQVVTTATAAGEQDPIHCPHVRTQPPTVSRSAEPELSGCLDKSI